jgi:hypothetical protein
MFDKINEFFINYLKNNVFALKVSERNISDVDYASTRENILVQTLWYDLNKLNKKKLYQDNENLNNGYFKVGFETMIRYDSGHKSKTQQAFNAIGNFILNSNHIIQNLEKTKYYELPSNILIGESDLLIIYELDLILGQSINNGESDNMNVLYFIRGQYNGQQ